MKVDFSAAAEGDLEEISDYTAKDSPRRALTFVRELRASAELLADMPSRATLRALRYSPASIPEPSHFPLH